MLNDYIYLRKSNEKRVFISNLLHDIKYEKNIDALYTKYSDVSLSCISDLPKEEFVELCVLATYVEQAFCNRKLKPPQWVHDKCLILAAPHFAGFKAPDLVLHATQACLNHNVFLSRSDFEVV